MSTRMPPRGVAIGDAACHRIYWQCDPEEASHNHRESASEKRAGGPSLEQCVELVKHPTSDAKRPDLVEAIAYLAAQVVEYRNSADQNARLYMAQIGHNVDEYRRQYGMGATP